MPEETLAERSRRLVGEMQAYQAQRKVRLERKLVASLDAAGNPLGGYKGRVQAIREELDSLNAELASGQGEG